jgi:hypothetical protein
MLGELSDALVLAVILVIAYYLLRIAWRGR